MGPRDFSNRFSAALRRSLAANGRRSITAATFAREFNLRAGALGPISDETARRWLRGDALPELPRMAVLIDWLRIDPVALFSGTSRPGSEQPSATAEPVARTDSPGHSSVDADDELARQLAIRLGRLGSRERSALRQVAELLAELDEDALRHRGSRGNYPRN